MRARACARGGWTLLETIFAVSIFAVILMITFLPFKILSDSFRLSGGRIDTHEAVRVPLQRMVRDIRQGMAPPSPPMLSNSFTLASGQTAFRSITFTSLTNSAQVTYYWQQLTVVQPPSVPLVSGDPYLGFSLLKGGQPTEWALMRSEVLNGNTSPGFPKAVIPRGLVQFYLQYFNPDASTDYPSILIYLMAYPADARRPLPDTSKAPIEFGTTFGIRNIGSIQ